MPARSSPIVAGTDHDDVIDCPDDSLIEQIWRDLDRQVSRERVRQVATEVAAEYRTATVTAFIPLFIRRQTHEKLKVLVNESR